MTDNPKNSRVRRWVLITDHFSWKMRKWEKRTLEIQEKSTQARRAAASAPFKHAPPFHSDLPLIISSSYSSSRLTLSLQTKPYQAQNGRHRSRGRTPHRAPIQTRSLLWWFVPIAPPPLTPTNLSFVVCSLPPEVRDHPL